MSNSANDTRRVGVVEIGSRAIRLLVADISPTRGLVVVSTAWREAPLGALVKGGKEALRAKLEEVDGIVREFVARCRQMGPSRLCVFGTEALRKISEERMCELSKVMPYLTILDKKSEALCSLVGAIRGFSCLVSDGEEVLVVDQGAGSMELAVGKLSESAAELLSYKSYELGTQPLVGLFKRCGGHIPRLRERVEKRISAYELVTVGRGPTIVLGSAATKCAWIKVRREPSEAYAPGRVHGQIVSLDQVDKLFEEAMIKPEEMRKVIDPRNPSGDEYEIVVSGLVALSIVLRTLRKTEFTVSAWGTRHGLAWVLARDEPRAREFGCLVIPQ
jgi:exopolyphosphatase/guanosine-5'-triphosphate,3'-diphosphate pyrophosphatase